MAKRLHSGSSPHKTEKYKQHFLITDRNKARRRAIREKQRQKWADINREEPTK